ncbi:adenylate cyclase related protein [Leptospira ryugenii]|uniref:Adenylate cyclase related protein n=1 Tax=Leptospira ryugenii TaxID=1917863 RepID=A0A2P2DZX6_9LEPT|nr:adenylate/guanylate cyclase domain-containing protein [Leptospira ryugenii]GBF50191.1 adenylate cyclase related protein [Leptospira ryugenii]
MIEKEKQNQILVGAILVYFLVPISANFFALLFGDYTSSTFLPKADLTLFNFIMSSRDLLMVMINWGPFPIVSILISIYSYPLVRYILGKELSPSEIEVARRRLINTPFMISLLGLIGWETATTLSVFRSMQLLPVPDMDPVYRTFLVFAFWGFFVFAFTFFTVDYLGKKFLIPCFFPEGGLGKYVETSRFSLVSKSVIIWFSISFFPITLMLFSLLNRSSQRLSDILFVLQSDRLFQLCFVLLFFSFWIVLVHARSIQEPLKILEEATYKIKDQLFETKVIVNSTDELAILADSFNDMVRGLEEKERIKDTFGRIVDPRVRDYLLNNKHELGGKTVDATILFSDLRDFTQLSENRSPEAVLNLLNRYFQAMSDAIESEGGFINKFIGDAILAVFGTPIPLHEPELVAFRTAKKMQSNLESLNKELERDGLPSLKMGIGIHRGSVLIGNIGAQNRMEFTVIGDTVNTASRVEGLCKGLNKQLLLTEAMYQCLPEGERKQVAFLGEFELKGRLTKENIYG